MKSIVRRLPYVGQVFLERDELKAELTRYKTWVPPGHFYSPIPSLTEIRSCEGRIFQSSEKTILAVDLNEAGQLELFDTLGQYYGELPFGSQKRKGLRYYFENPAYSYCDAIILYCMIRHFSPKRFIEVGSGYSSCVVLDTNELFFDNRISLTFIEPHTELLFSLIKESDKETSKIIPTDLQDVGLEVFSELCPGDILFIDSTHVSKIGSDVNHIFFEILPRLARGVYIHFHDVFYPFEYPKEWIYEGRAWNEIYLLRAFLQYNPSFQIVLFNDLLCRVHPDKLLREMPLCMKHPGGSIWLRKI